MSEPSAAERAVADAHRREWAKVLGATVRVNRDLDAAEECVQEAYAAALISWARDGVPDNPGAWLTTTAKRRAVDHLRRHATESKLSLLFDGDEADGEEDSRATDHDLEFDAVPDERLRLLFMCCHPALQREAQVALTLRLVCGMATADIARVLLVSPTTMSARLTRAKKKIVVARIRVAVPAAAELPERLDSVLAVIYLLFTSGHSAPSGASLLRVELLEESLHLARMLRGLMPDEAEAAGLLALMLLNDARRSARLDGAGMLVRLEDQNRSLWDRSAIDEARELVRFVQRRGRMGRYALQAAIALQYVEAASFDDTNWQDISRLYDELLRVWPSPVVALNRAVVVARTVGAQSALDLVEGLEADGRLDHYSYLFAVKAELLLQLERLTEAKAALGRAAELAANDVERLALIRRLDDAVTTTVGRGASR